MTGYDVVAAAASAAASVAASVTTSATAQAAETASGGAIPTDTIGSIVTSVVPSIVASVLPSGATTTTPVTDVPLFLPVGFEVAAIFAGAVAGGMVGVRQRFDILGVSTLAIVGGLGGGMIRDVLLQKYGIFALESPTALVTALIGALVAAFFFSVAERLRLALAAMDSISLALFCLIGADKALVAGLQVVPAILLGGITAVGGGMLRDILCDREPDVLRRGSIYGLAAIAGSTVFVGMVTWLNFSKGWALVTAGLFALALRGGSVVFGWESPEPVDLTDRLVGPPTRGLRKGRELLVGRGKVTRSEGGSTPEDDGTPKQREAHEEPDADG